MGKLLMMCPEEDLLISAIFMYLDVLCSFTTTETTWENSFFLGNSLVAKAFRVFNTRRQEIKETYHVTFNEVDEVITHTSTNGDEINFNENRSFHNDEFLLSRRNPSQSTRNYDYLPYVPAFDHLFTNNIIILETVILTTLNINSSNKSPEFSIDDDHPIHNEPDDFEPA
uniref:Retrovirus-related Pol polyprotein from transposon TNT 1-94 n=1 Tax=Tanacetum cinerariifolium TaxID=118510 RepID=A0A699IK06_TANCI|nr:retrovirus-related Pol polyprotein from transposon TNT 1-94 [Tanacetum cinerariifolium]